MSSRRHKKRKKYNIDTKPKNNIKPPKGLVTDSFSNVLARLGYGTPNLLEGTEYPLTRLTQDYGLMNSLYRSNWIIRKIIDTIPDDMCKNWIQVSTELEPDQIRQLQKLERRTKLKAKILEGLKWGRLYGGAGGLIIIDGHENILDQPLEYDDIMPDSFKGLFITDRWSGITPSQNIVEDINSPDFGTPEFYNVVADGGKIIRVHHSRVVKFIGRKLPYWEELAEQYWGASEVEIVFDELKKRDNTSWNIAQLIFLADLRVLKLDGVREMLSIGNDKAAQRAWKAIEAQNMLMSNMGLQILNSGEELERHPYSFSGLNDIYQSFMLDVAGACEIPVTRLFGRSPAGMDATGESDMLNYYDTIEEKQESTLRPVLDQLLPVLCMSEFGAMPDDLDYDFNPVRTPDGNELADLSSKNTAVVISAYTNGLVSQKTALRELKQQSNVTGLFSNISDEEIEKADDSTVDEGELEGLNNYGSENSSGPLEAEKINREEISKNIKTGNEDSSTKFKWFKKSKRNT